MLVLLEMEEAWMLEPSKDWKISCLDAKEKSANQKSFTQGKEAIVIMDGKWMGKAEEMGGEIQEGIKEKIGMAGGVISGVGEVSAQSIAINGVTNREMIENIVNSKLNHSIRIH